MPITTSDITALYLADFGEPVTLSYAATTRHITAVVNDIREPGSPLDGIPAREEHSITCDPADVMDVTTAWTVTTRGITRPVLASVPADGLIVIHLGDEQ